MSTKRNNQKKFVLSLLPLIYLFVFTPGCIYFLFTFEEDFDKASVNWKTMDEDDLHSIDYDTDDGIVNVSTPLKEIVVDQDSSMELYASDQMVVWNNSGMSQMVIIPQYEEVAGGQVFHEIWIITDITITFLIENDITDLKIEWNCSRSVTVSMDFISMTDEGILAERERFGSSNQNHSGEWIHSWDIIDLLEFQIEIQDERLIFSVEDEWENFTIGDRFDFRIQIEDGEDDPWLTQQTILQIGGFVMGGSSLVIAMMISPLWNPSPGSKPGIIDKIIVWIQKTWRKIRNPFNRNRRRRK